MRSRLGHEDGGQIPDRISINAGVKKEGEGKNQDFLDSKNKFRGSDLIFSGKGRKASGKAASRTWGREKKKGNVNLHQLL